jgi:hypothetical protein
LGSRVIDPAACPNLRATVLRRSTPLRMRTRTSI